MPYIMINGIKQEFETFGDVRNPALILLFGGAIGPAGWHNWDYKDTIARLSKEYYVIGYDRRGHGVSAFPEGTLEDIIKDMVTLLDILCIEKANVVGLSAGTYVLGCAAGMIPDRLKSMILIVPHSHTSGGSPATLLMRRLGIDSARATPEDQKRIARLGWGEKTPNSVIAEYTAWSESLPTYPPLPLEQNIAAFASIANFDHRENFKKLKLPTLVISGEQDKYCPCEYGREIAESIDGGRYIEFEGCGHMLFWERHEEVMTAMLDFLRSVN